MVYALAEWNVDRPYTSFSAKLVSRSEVISVTVRPVNAKLVEIENSPDDKFKAGKVMHLYNKANEEMAELIILPHPVERLSETWSQKYYSKWYPKDDDDKKLSDSQPNYYPGDSKIVDFGNTDDWIYCFWWAMFLLLGLIFLIAMLASCEHPHEYNQFNPPPVQQRWERDVR